MRLSRSCKLLIKLAIVIGIFVLAIYCLHSPNVFAEVSSLFLDAQNISGKSNATTTLSKDLVSSKQQFLSSNKSNSIDNGTTAQLYNVWCIFTKVTSNSPMRRKFRIFVHSLLSHSSIGIHFHIVTDDESQIIAEKVIDYVFLISRKTMKVQYYNIHKSAAEIEDIVLVMSPHFSSKPGTYYSDALFFLSLGLYRIASTDQDLAVIVDADTKFKIDIKELFKEFDSFGKEALFGLGPELTPVYRHVLYIYRSKNPKTKFGEPGYLGGYPGYNSGVVLLNLKRLRESLEYDQIVSQDSVEHMVDKYNFKGHLGDQDFYTLLGMERPELIHTIDCGWNRQLCTWWRDRGYADVFANYSHCHSETKLWHGNCNTPIPED
ncbi:PREDICTED: xyloside xylosyltransferase 1 [Ceratosolen solmsi marchali]|uniref:Xyloside xylosyltransferase 1 n=1 Tax=Ceratosolen solmsi marchali TaxID=326594 RepID=A0AAJ7DX49_9HYME|nr:PREDICTED: xyloside xylosyltransferase 1 [Ceratosolen solmsi marchali]